MNLWTKFAPMKIRFVHRKFGFARWLIVGFERRFIHRIATEIKHARERCKNEYLRFFSHKDGRFDIHGRNCTILHNEFVATRQAFTIEERIELQKIIRRVRLLHPKLAKIRKFFRLTNTGVNGKPTRRESPVQAFGNYAKIARSEERHKLILNAGLTRWNESLEAYEALMPAETERVIVVKVFRRKRDVANTIFLDRLKQHPPFKVVAWMKKSEVIGQISPDRPLRKEAYPAIKIIIQILKVARKLLVLRHKRLLREGLGLLNDILVTKHILFLCNCCARQTHNKERRENFHTRIDDGNTIYIKSTRKILDLFERRSRNSRQFREAAGRALLTLACPSVLSPGTGHYRAVLDEVNFHLPSYDL